MFLPDAEWKMAEVLAEAVGLAPLTGVYDPWEVQANFEISESILNNLGVATEVVLCVQGNDEYCPHTFGYVTCRIEGRGFVFFFGGVEGPDIDVAAAWEPADSLSVMRAAVVRAYFHGHGGWLDDDFNVQTVVVGRELAGAMRRYWRTHEARRQAECG